MKKVSLLSETVYCIVDAAALACAGMRWHTVCNVRNCMMGGGCVSGHLSSRVKTYLFYIEYAPFFTSKT